MSITRTTGLSALLLAAGVAGTISTLTASGSATAELGVQRAHATIVDAAGNDVGFATFVEDLTGRVHVNVKVAGLAPGDHGIHVHANGVCGSDFIAAGGHHNPMGVPHGEHSGDLPNLIVNESGQGRLNDTSEKVTLSAGLLSALDGNGSAIVIHAAADDFVSQPSGNSGGRIACGVIVAD
jgi:Cu-Zn family superoxide dismutase